MRVRSYTIARHAGCAICQYWTHAAPILTTSKGLVKITIPFPNPTTAPPPPPPPAPPQPQLPLAIVRPLRLYISEYLLPGSHKLICESIKLQATCQTNPLYHGSKSYHSLNMYHHPKNFHFDKFTSLIQGKNILIKSINHQRFNALP